LVAALDGEYSRVPCKTMLQWLLSPRPFLSTQRRRELLAESFGRVTVRQTTAFSPRILEAEQHNGRQAADKPKTTQPSRATRLEQQEVEELAEDNNVEAVGEGTGTGGEAIQAKVSVRVMHRARRRGGATTWLGQHGR